ncbi:MAG: hypothetical protein WAL22_08540 [Solirubrobacteraceae bacterium]
MSPSPQSTADRFSFRFAPAYRAAGLCFGIVPGSTEAIITLSRLVVHFGPWRVDTALDNILDSAITGPYTFLKTAGPARLGLTDRGLTFATNGDRGVRLSFRSSIKGIEPTGRLRHPELTLTVADVNGFAGHVEALRRAAA